MKVSITKTKFDVHVNGEVIPKEMLGVVSVKTIMSKLYERKIFGEIDNLRTVYEHYDIPEDVMKQYYVDEVEGKRLKADQKGE